MPEPSGLSFGYISNVTDAEFDAASAALDRALLRAIGLPEAVEVREFENAVYAMGEKIKRIFDNFTLSKLIAILPELVIDAEALWTKLEPQIGDQVTRVDFITKVVRYLYRKHNPDLPVLAEPFETVVEELLLNAVPALIEVLDEQVGKLWERLKALFS